MSHPSIRHFQKKRRKAIPLDMRAEKQRCNFLASDKGDGLFNDFRLFCNWFVATVFNVCLIFEKRIVKFYFYVMAAG